MSTTPDPAEGKLAYELDRAHVFHSWSAQGALKPFVVAGALGSTVWDYDGTEYLDFSSQLVNMNIGHQHPKVIEAIKAQADVLTMVAPAHANIVARPGGQAHPRTRRGVRSARFSSPTAVRMRTRMRSGWRGSSPVATRSCRSTVRTTATRVRRSGRRGTGVGCPTSTRAGMCTSSDRSRTTPSSGLTRRSRRPSARCTTWSAPSRPRAATRSRHF